LATTDFAHLHLHTQYSFLDGAIRMKDLVKRVDELGMKQVAVTDHGNMFGALDFYKRARGAGIKPILGMEAYVTGVTGDTMHTDKVRENFHLVLLAENNTGYANLKKLSSTAFIDGKYYYPRVDRELLREHREGVIALTACLGGEVGKKVARGENDQARETIRTFKDIFGPDHFFLEVQPNGIDKQNVVNATLAEMAKDEGLKLVATNDCHYVTRDDHEAQNILMAIRQQKQWGDPGLHIHETDAFYIRSGDEMYDLLKTDFSSAFEMACEIGSRCNVELELGKYYLPPFPIEDGYKDEPDYLRHISRKGLERRFGEMSYEVDREEYFARLDVELDVIISMGFAGYFLIVQDFINWSKQEQIRVGPGRGSGAGSLVAYALRITDLDPLPYNLLFERFLNPERVSMPDFDVDFMQERRGEVINYVSDKYGRERVGQIATYAGLNPKSAVKDVARTLGVPFGEINELTKPMPLLIEGKKPTLDQALEYAPQLKELGESDEKFRRILNIARVLEGLFRQAGMHAGGVVIGEDPLVDYVPLFTGSNGELITQFDKDKVEDAGLVKFDFLGLKTLDVIEFAEKFVNTRIARENELPPAERAEAAKKHPHVPADWDPEQPIPTLTIDLLPPDDRRVYKLISSGDTAGVFQVESQGFAEMCRKLKPDCFEDIVAAVALYRPGPMQSGMVDDFIDRKHGRKRVEYPHPLLEEVLEPTYGTIVYQEQVMQAAQVLAGFTLGGADILRRAMGKKKFEVMQEERKKFVSGAREHHDIAEEDSGAIFDLIEKFAGYGFNKSHSAAYALITYQTGYLKRFYPVEFMAALLTTEMSSSDNVVKYIHEARTHGIEVLPPDINVSDRRFTVDYNVDEATRRRRRFRSTAYGRVRFGLGAVKGLGDSAIEAIRETRERTGGFTDIYHLCEEMPDGKLNKKVLEVLTKSGALDNFGQSRAALFATVERAIEAVAQLKKDRASGQTNMFEMFSAAGGGGEIQKTYLDVPEWSEKERLAFEREAVGFYLSGHPLDRYTDDAKKLGAIPTVELLNQRHNSEAQIVGIVAGMRERLLKSGDGRWAVVTLEDTFGQAEVLAFSKVFEESEMALKSGEPLMIKGRVLIDDIDDDGQQLTPKMRAAEVGLLAEEQIKRTRWLEVHIEVPPDDEELEPSDERFDPTTDDGQKRDLANEARAKKALEQIRRVVDEHRGEVPARIKLSMPAGYRVTLGLPEDLRVHPDDDLLMQLERVKDVVQVVRV
jgi:DNA polymerase-3 subunit alpha